MSAVIAAYVPRPAGEVALTYAIAEARRRDAKLYVVNATRGDALVDERYVQGDAQETLERRLADLDIPAELRQYARGRDVSDELATLADEVEAELLVIGLRKRSQVGKLLMGSAATRILIAVDCPVVCVKH